MDSVINSKRVYRLMKLQGTQSVTRKKRKKYIGSTPQQVAENILNRKFEEEMPNQKWVTDVTEFKYGNGKKAYLICTTSLLLLFVIIDYLTEVAAGWIGVLRSKIGMFGIARKVFIFAMVACRSLGDGHIFRDMLARIRVQWLTVSRRMILH